MFSSVLPVGVCALAVALALRCGDGHSPSHPHSVDQPTRTASDGPDAACGRELPVRQGLGRDGVLPPHTDRAARGHRHRNRSRRPAADRDPGPHRREPARLRPVPHRQREGLHRRPAREPEGGGPLRASRPRLPARGDLGEELQRVLGGFRGRPVERVGQARADVLSSELQAGCLSRRIPTRAGRLPAAGAGNRTPQPIDHFNAKVHIKGPEYYTLDSTPIVGPDANYCAAIGYTDGRAWCPVRAEGSRDRVECENWRVGKAKDTGRDGPTWQHRDGETVEYCKGLKVNGCENHPDNQYGLLAARGGTYVMCAAERRLRRGRGRPLTGPTLSPTRQSQPRRSQHPLDGLSPRAARLSSTGREGRRRARGA